MNRYIDADALIGKMRGCFIDSIEENIAVQIIKSAPSIDIVRCSECKYWNTNGKYYDKCEFHGIVSMDANTFCSYGGRKESE